jgi:hypothetical protein
MAIEIRNLSITSRVVQRQADQAGEPPRVDSAPRDAAPSEGWDVERRRLMAQLQELRRER